MKSKQPNNKKLLSSFNSLFLSPGLQRLQEDIDINWSADIPQAPVSPSQHVPPVSEHVLLPHVPLYNKSPNGKNRVASAAPSILDYSEGQPAISDSWDGTHHVLSIFGTENTIYKDSAMIYNSLGRLRNFIKYNLVDSGLTKRELESVVKYLWNLIDTIYTAKWNTLIFNKEKNLTIRKYIGDRIIPYYRQNQLSTLTSNITMANPSSLPAAEAAPPPATNISAAPPPPNKNVEFTVKKGSKPSNMKKSYTQASKANIACIKDIVQVKKVFPDLSADRAGKVLKVKNSREGNKKPKINMMIRGPSRKEIIIPMANHIAELIVNSAYIHITNINKCLKNSKSDIVADFI